MQPNYLTLRVGALVDLHAAKMLIIQLHRSSVGENVCHTIFIQYRKKVEKR